MAILSFVIVGKIPKSTPQETRNNRAHTDNASVWCFLLGYAVLIRSCFGVLHCLPDAEDEPGSHLGHLQSDPDTKCDVRSTWVMVFLVASSLAVFSVYYLLFLNDRRDSSHELIVREVHSVAIIVYLSLCWVTERGLGLVN